jgi:hypothetical protein
MAERTRARKNWIEDRPQAANLRKEIGHWGAIFSSENAANPLC